LALKAFGTATFFKKSHLNFYFNQFLFSSASVKTQLGSSADPPVRLIMAGGYDERLLENVAYYKELKAFADKTDLVDSVTFLQSPDDSVKTALLHGADVLVYTPDRQSTLG